MRATRDDSGWNTADPSPTTAAAAMISGNVSATDSSSSPTNDTVMPMASENGLG